MKQALYIKPPTRKQLFMLRLMVFFGVIAMGFFLLSVFSPSVRSYAPLYWMLVVTFVFSCLKVLHEWYHYIYITVPFTPPLTRRYTIDIFTTFCAGEPYEMIVGTLTAIQKITYPHETYLCDEADDPYLRKVCAELGVHHVTRTVKEHAKAGNINNALGMSKGELCVVLDPDHVPFPHFLDPIVPHFDDPEIGYVQIVQAYKNHDESLIAKGAAQQTYQFYGPMMMTMNRYGTVLAIGANCTFRRSALDSIGGHAAGLAEDMHTSMQLHAKGWKSVYVPAVLARGLVPSTLSAYYKQQLKWSRGVFDLFVHIYPKLFTQFTWSQKLHYGIIPLHYLSGFIYLINFLIPIISLVLGVSPMHFDLTDFGLVVLPMTACIILIRHFVQWWVMEDEERGFHVVGGLLMIGTWWIYILGVIYTIAGKKIPYDPTPKDGNEANNWPLNIPNLAILALSLGAIAYGLYEDLNPYNLIMAGFAGLNCFFMCFTIAASRQQQIRAFAGIHPAWQSLFGMVKELKGNFWILRRKIYSGVRASAFLISLLVISIILYFKGFDPQLERSLALAKENEAFAQSLAKQRGPHPYTVRDLYRVMGVSFPLPAGKPMPQVFRGLRAVNYTKGHNWSRRQPAFTKRELEEDLEEMQRTGIQAIRHFGPGIYDYNVLNATAARKMQVHYTFWITQTIDFVNDKNAADALCSEIVSTVHKLKHRKHIVSWNLGNIAFQEFPADKRFIARQKYFLNWLKKTAAAIKAGDPGRPLSFDLQLTQETPEMARLVHQLVPEINVFSLVVVPDAEELPDSDVLARMHLPYFFGYVDVNTYQQLNKTGAGAFISNWQDERIFEHVSFDGLRDYTGRPKATLARLRYLWNGGGPPPSAPDFKILKPAVGTFEGLPLDYHAIAWQNGEWQVADKMPPNLRFEWKLVRTDGFQNPIEMTDAGTGPRLTLTIPNHPSLYRLYLYVLDGQTVMAITGSQLNTPLQTAKRR